MSNAPYCQREAPSPPPAGRMEAPQASRLRRIEVHLRVELTIFAKTGAFLQLSEGRPLAMLALTVSSLSWNAPLVNLNSPAMRASTPVMETFEEYKARVLEKPADGPPTIAGVAAARGSVKATKVSSPGTNPRPSRAESRPQLREMLHESSDLLSHQAIMENFVRRRLIRRLSPRAPRAPTPQTSPLTPLVVPTGPPQPVGGAPAHEVGRRPQPRRQAPRVHVAGGAHVDPCVAAARLEPSPFFILAAALLGSADLVFCLATQSFRSTRVSAPTRRSPSSALPSLTAASPNGTRPTVTVASSTSRRRSRTSARRRGAATRVPRQTASWTGSR